MSNLGLGSMKLNKGVNQKYIFFVDSMLGKLCVFLRILGKECVYVRNKKRNTNITNSLEVINFKNKIKIFVTKNKKKDTSDRLKKYNVIPDYVLVLPYVDIPSQLRIIKEVFPFIVFDFNEEETRCSICGSLLIKKSKQEVITEGPLDKINEHIPLKVLSHHDYFYYCPYCNKYYWKGKHWNNIKRILEQ